MPDDQGFAAIPKETIQSLDGLELLMRIIDGRLPQPPINASANLRFMSASPGEVMLTGTPDGSHANYFGTIHGGWISTLVDTALGCSVASTLASGEGFTTIEFKLNVMKPVMAGEIYSCTGKVLRRGRTTAVSTAELADAAGNLIGFALGTCAILHNQSATTK